MFFPRQNTAAATKAELRPANDLRRHPNQPQPTPTAPLKDPRLVWMSGMFLRSSTTGRECRARVPVRSTRSPRPDNNPPPPPKCSPPPELLLFIVNNHNSSSTRNACDSGRASSPMFRHIRHDADWHLKRRIRMRICTRASIYKLRPWLRAFMLLLRLKVLFISRGDRCRRRN